MTLVSVVIPTRDRAALLREAIESVLAIEHHHFSLEIIVVDDGSSDDTAAVVAQYDTVTCLQTQGLGASAARNAGIAAAHGDFIAFLDDDDVWLPTNITPQLDLFAANPAYGAVHAQVTMTGPDRKSVGAPTPAGPLASGWIFEDLLTYWPQLDSVVIRQSVLQTVGMFDVMLRNAEDWDLMLRIARRYPIGRVEQPTALFRQRCDNDEVHTFREVPDMVRVFRRHVSEVSLWRRLLLQRVLWAHRGKIAANLADHAQAHCCAGALKRAVRSMRYALATSPAHALKRNSFWHVLGHCTRVAAQRAVQ